MLALFLLVFIGWLAIEIYEQKQLFDIKRKVAFFIPLQRGEYMIKHYITKYQENGQRFAESWLQINLFGKCYCFSRKLIKI